MRIESSVTSLSWIPSEAIKGMTKLPFERGVTHYDKPPPDVIDDLEALRRADRFRFANVLRAWIEVEDGRVVGHGYTGFQRGMWERSPASANQTWTLSPMRTVSGSTSVTLPIIRTPSSSCSYSQ